MGAGLPRARLPIDLVTVVPPKISDLTFKAGRTFLWKPCRRSKIIHRWARSTIQGWNERQPLRKITWRDGLGIAYPPPPLSQMFFFHSVSRICTVPQIPRSVTISNISSRSTPVYQFNSTMRSSEGPAKNPSLALEQEANFSYCTVRLSLAR